MSFVLNAYISARDAASAPQNLQVKTSAFTTAPEYVDALLFGYSWSGAADRASTVSYTYDASFNGGSKISLAAQRAALEGMQHYSDVANIHFTPGTINSELQFSRADLPADSDGEVLGIAYTLTTGTNIAKVEVQLDNDYTNEQAVRGQLGYQVMMHELGHAIGLKHPFDSDSGNGTTLDSAFDSWDYTIMSYTAGTLVSDSNYATGLMALDIAAAQYLYGANMSYHTGNDLYLFDGSKKAFAIWDAGGTDSIVASVSNVDVLINLSENVATGTHADISHIGSSVFSPAIGVDIEYAKGANGNDTIYGGTIANTLLGHLGNDSIEGMGGNDTLYGGQGIVDLVDGSDTIFGGDGLDLIYGNAGNDSLYGGSDATDAAIENDTIYGGFGSDQLFGGAGDDQLYGGGAAGDPRDPGDTIYGGQGADTIIGNGGDDVIYGGDGTVDTTDGNDVIYGGFGNDTIYGNAGDDVIWSNQGNDYIVGGGGRDYYVFYNDSGIDSIFQYENPGNNLGDTIYVLEFVNGTSIATPQDMLSRITYVGTHAEIDLGKGNMVLVYGLGDSHLTVSDFFVYGLS